MKKILLTEAQVNKLVLLESVYEILKEEKNEEGMREKIREFLVKGISGAAIVIALINSFNMDRSEAQNIVNDIQLEIQHVSNDVEKAEEGESEWTLATDDVVATVYNAEPKQCNNDISHTASMFRLNLSNVLSHRIIAMERTMMSEYGLKYGDVVKIEGPGKWDGVWQIQDTMNKKYKGQHKIDILIPKSKGLGKWSNVKLYKLTDAKDASKHKSGMAPQLSKAEAKKQAAKIKSGELKTV